MSDLMPQYYGGEQAASESAFNAKIVAPTMKQRIDAAVKDAEARLVSAKRAAELFAKNPDLEELLNLFQRNHF